LDETLPNCFLKKAPKEEREKKQKGKDQNPGKQTAENR